MEYTKKREHKIDFPKYITHQGARETCEDKQVHHRYLNGDLLMGIFDGHGGSTVSDYCANNLIRIFNSLPGGMPDDEKLGHSIKKLNGEIKEQNLTPMQGSTGVIAYISEETGVINVANIGDTMAFILDASELDVMKTSKGTLNKYKDFLTSDSNRAVSYSYKTKAHAIHEPDDGKLEQEYYKKHDLKIKQSDGSYYLNLYDDVYLQPLRVIGDFEYDVLIREPDIYKWKIKNTSANYLVMISDGFENHNAFDCSKMSFFLINPILALLNIKYMVEDTVLLKSGEIKMSSLKILEPENYKNKKKAMDNIKSNFDIISCKSKRSVFSDIVWYKAIVKAHGDMFSLLDKFELNWNIKNRPREVLELLAIVSIMLGSDDNLSICVTCF